MQQNMAPPNRIFGAQHVTAPPPNRAPTNRAPDPREADEMLADENQRLAENKRRARLAERMRDREDQLAHMANYALGGADGGEQDLALLVRNQQQNLQNGRRLLGIDQQEQARKPQAMQRPPAGEKAQDKPALQVHSDNRREDSVPRFGAIVSNMAGRKEMVKNSLFGDPIAAGGAPVPQRAESERDRRLRERKAQARGGPGDAPGEQAGAGNAGDKRPDLFGGGGGGGDGRGGVPASTAQGQAQPQSRREQVYEEKRRRHLQKAADPSRNDRNGVGVGGAAHGGLEGTSRFESGSARHEAGGGEPTVAQKDVNGGGGREVAKNRRDAVWEEKRRLALERAQGGASASAGRGDEWPKPQFPQVASPHRFDDLASGGGGGGGGDVGSEFEKRHGGVVPGRNDAKSGELDLLDQAFHDKMRRMPVSKPTRRQDQMQGKEQLHQIRGNHAHAHAPVQPSQHHQRPHQHHPYADQDGQPSHHHNQAWPQHDNGNQPNNNPSGGAFGAEGDSVGLSVAGGRRQNMSNMYQDDNAVREEARRKAEYAKELQSQMHTKPPGLGPGAVYNGGMESTLPGGGNLFGMGGGGGGRGTFLRVGGGHLPGMQVKPSLSNMHGGGDGGERERKQAYAEDLQNQMRLKANVNQPRGPPHDGRGPGGGHEVSSAGFGGDQVPAAGALMGGGAGMLGGIGGGGGVGELGGPDAGRHHRARGALTNMNNDGAQLLHENAQKRAVWRERGYMPEHAQTNALEYQAKVRACTDATHGWDRASKLTEMHG